MSMNQEMEQTFQMFMGMVGQLGSLAKPTDMPDAERVSRAKKVFLEKTTWDIATELEGCIHCGLCAEACHFQLSTGDAKYTPARKFELMRNVYRRELSPMRWLYKLVLPDITVKDLEESQELVYDSCTMCARCSMICPMGIHIAELVDYHREALAAAGMVPAEMRALDQEQEATGHIFEATEEVLQFKVQELSEKFGIAIPLNKEGAEVMVLTSGLDLHLFNDAMVGTAKILNHAKINWTFWTDSYEGANFGFMTGDTASMAKQVSRVVDAATKHKAKVVIVPECGHSYPALRFYGAEATGKPLPFDVMAPSEYIAKLHDEGKLKLKKPEDRKVVTFHDPCKVGRHAGVFEGPRDVLKSMGLEVRETEDNRMVNFCCGGGAAVFLLDRANDLRQKAFELKFDEVKRTRAEALVVSCGSCRLNFERGKMNAGETLPVDSFAQIVGDNLAS
jgi:Fe-S oxidoreductase